MLLHLLVHEQVKLVHLGKHALGAPYSEQALEMRNYLAQKIFRVKLDLRRECTSDVRSKQRRYTLTTLPKELLSGPLLAPSQQSKPPPLL